MGAYLADTEYKVHSLSDAESWRERRRVTALGVEVTESKLPQSLNEKPSP